MHVYFLEAVGTFALSLVVALSITGAFPVSTPILAALTLGLFVYTIGGITGAHINPAVTAAAWSLKKIDGHEAASYIIAQFLGAAGAFFLAQMFVPGLLSFQTPPASLGIAFAEGLGAFFFAFGIAAVIFEKVPEQLSGVVVGGSLLLGIAIASLSGSFGILNPAVALALNSFNVMYLVGPVLGAIIGMWTYKLFCTKSR